MLGKELKHEGVTCQAVVLCVNQHCHLPASLVHCCGTVLAPELSCQCRSCCLHDVELQACSFTICF